MNKSGFSILIHKIYLFQHVFLMENPWSCDCHLKDFRNYVLQKSLSPSPVTCYEPERLSDKTWAELAALDFACKPSARISPRYLVVPAGMNSTIECLITGSPLPDVKWVLDGRIIANMSAPPHSSVLAQKYVITENTRNNTGRNKVETNTEPH